ncbi:MAG TPA: response regulator [Candidatus Binataceae bacterium]|nr:response regulator [Candidatus Binataceae bacterium]
MTDSVANVRSADRARPGGSGKANVVELPSKATGGTIARVMVIDDSPDVVSVLSRFLKNEGCVPIEAHSGKEGLALLAEDDVDLIFLDLMMPEMDGFEVFKAIKTGRNAHVPVIMMTARNDHDARDQAERLGIREFLSKPVFRSQLTQKLRAQLHPEPPEHPAEGHHNSMGSYVHFRNDLHDRVWSENWSSRFMRPGLLMIALFEMASIASGAWLTPEIAARHLPFEILNAVAAFACVAFMWSARFRSQWREAGMAFAFVILMAASFLSMATQHSEPLMMAIVLMLLGAGALIPWNSRWQWSLTILCLGWFATTVMWMPDARTGALDRWLALIAAASLALVGIARNEYQRRQFESRIVFAEGTPEN